MSFPTMAVCVKNNFIHVMSQAEIEARLLRRTRSCEVDLAPWSVARATRCLVKKESCTSLTSCSTSVSSVSSSTGTAFTCTSPKAWSKLNLVKDTVATKDLVKKTVVYDPYTQRAL